MSCCYFNAWNNRKNAQIITVVYLFKTKLSGNKPQGIAILIAKMTVLNPNLGQK